MGRYKFCVILKQGVLHGISPMTCRKENEKFSLPVLASPSQFRLYWGLQLAASSMRELQQANWNSYTRAVLGLTQLVLGSSPLQVMPSWLEASRQVCLCLTDSPLQSLFPSPPSWEFPQANLLVTGVHLGLCVPCKNNRMSQSWTLTSSYILSNDS